MRNNRSPSNVLILAGGALLLVGSFLAFYTFQDGFGGEFKIDAWDRPMPLGLFGIVTVAVLCGVVMGVQVGLQIFSTIGMPERLLGLTWDQLHLALGSQALLLMLTFLARKKAPLEFGIGFWCMFAGSVALFVGALLRLAAARRRPRLI